MGTHLKTTYHSLGKSFTHNTQLCWVLVYKQYLAALESNLKTTNSRVRNSSIKNTPLSLKVIYKQQTFVFTTHLVTAHICLGKSSTNYTQVFENFATNTTHLFSFKCIFKPTCKFSQKHLIDHWSRIKYNHIQNKSQLSTTCLSILRKTINNWTQNSGK